MSKKQKKNSKETIFFKQVAINSAWFFLLVGVFFWAYKAISQENVLPIKEISISGEFDQLSAQELHSLVVEGFQGNFFTLSVKEIYQKFYALPWVEQIWVHRVWPDKINIEIREQKAVAILKNKGLLNVKGEVFVTDVAQFKKTLPLFDVVNEYEAQAIKAYHQYDQMLSQSGLVIRQFEFDRRKSQTLILSNGIKLKLGRVNTENRLNRFIKAHNADFLTLPHMSRATKVKKIEGIDLRYTNGFAVKWKQTKENKVSANTANNKNKRKMNG